MSTKRRTKPHRWTAVATTSIPDPKLVHGELPPGRPIPRVIVTQLIDDQGRHWEKYGDDPPVLLGGPPMVNDTGG